MKKTLIITILGIVIVGLGVLAYFILRTPNEITITFNSAGGTQIKEMKVKKEESIHLPSSTKEGFVFGGWYLNNEKIDDTYKFTENVTLMAKWEEETKTFVITFDSKSGSKVNDITLECGKELTLPTNPTRSGYNFTSWQDKNGKVINNKALLACENVTLYANWSEVKKNFKVNFNSDGGSSIKTITVECNKSLPTLPTPTKSGYKFAQWQLNGKEVKSGTKLSCSDITLKAKWEKNVIYTCPSGYTLNGTKCTIEGKVLETCASNLKKDGTICVNMLDYNQGTRTCGKKIVNMGGGSTPTVQGVKVEAGTTFCYYGEVSDNKDTCQSRGRKWANSLGKCFIDMDQNYTTTCSSGYKYYSSSDILNKFGGHNNGGCYKTSSLTKSCETGFTLTGTKCIKTIDATAK